MITQETIVLIVYVIAIIFGLLLFVIWIFIAFQKRKNKLLVEQIEAEKRYERELATSQLEIQEQTFKNIGWELHDNVGQLLSVLSIQLNMMLLKAPRTIQKQLKDTSDVLGNTIQEVRNLSKTLNNEVVNKNGLIRSLEIEVERFNRLKYLEAFIQVNGKVRYISTEHEILIFRMYQEFLSNVMKHSKAKNLSVTLNFNANDLEIIAEDNGLGFDTSQKTESSGLQTIKGRAALLSAKYSLTSVINNGTKLVLLYTFPNDTKN
ncbi:MAG: histidine kinase [Flavobacteriaceae bacterium]|jgi:signal transduction histidine kinase|nr:histidine kinase [Flavobacteriaceae bacterium]MBT3919690.1 histidine kinase [Flavobacteriaceae bacterium]MBT6705683.1 histidine kinase [Flavobacteriaceae bacterium]MBT7242251.1 histidine kinase [Flavobacteriaceae bacterium]